MDWDYRNYDYLHAVMPTREADNLEQVNLIYKDIMRQLLLAAKGIA